MGVRRVQAVALPHSPSPHIYGLPIHTPFVHAHNTRSSMALHLVVYHDQGEFASVNMWPIEDARRLQRAVLALNAFLRTCEAPVAEELQATRDCTSAGDEEEEEKAIEEGEEDGHADEAKHVSFASLTDIELGALAEEARAAGQEGAAVPKEEPPDRPQALH